MKKLNKYLCCIFILLTNIKVKADLAIEQEWVLPNSGIIETKSLYKLIAISFIIALVSLIIIFIKISKKNQKKIINNGDKNV